MEEIEHSLDESRDDGATPDRSPGDRPLAELPGTLADRYRVLRVLGQGGMARVVLAEDARGERVAIKLVAAAERSRRERLLREAETVARLDSPGIVRVHEAVEGAASLAIVMDFVDGTDLERQARAAGPLPWRDAVGLLLGVVDALAHTHRRGVVHRDVKPANILLGADGVARLCDFGLARADEVSSLADSLTQAGTVLGTLDYMAPEQREDPRAVGAAADIFSLGATLYRLVVGEPPRVVREGRIPAEVRPVVLRCLEHRPEARFPNCEALGRAMRALVPEPVRVLPVRPGADGAAEPLAPTLEAPDPGAAARAREAGSREAASLDAVDVTERVAAALRYQGEQGGRIEEALSLVGLAPDTASYAALAAALDVPLLEAAPAVVPPEAARVLPRALAETYRLAPLRREGGALVLAAADPGDLGATLTAVGHVTGARLEACLALPEVVSAGIERAYGVLPPEPVAVFEPVVPTKPAPAKGAKPSRGSVPLPTGPAPSVGGWGSAPEVRPSEPTPAGATYDRSLLLLFVALVSLLALSFAVLFRL